MICVETVLNVVALVDSVVPPCTVADTYHWIVFPVGNVFAGMLTFFVFPDTLTWV